MFSPGEVNIREGSGGVNFSGGRIKVGGEVISGNSVKVNGKEVGSSPRLDLSGAPKVFETDSHVESIEQGGVVYVLRGRNKQDTKWVMERLEGKELEDYRASEAEKQRQRVQSRPEVNAQTERTDTSPALPTWESIKDQYPPDAIVSPDVTGGALQQGGNSYRLRQPIVQTDKGFVYLRTS